MTPAVHIQEIIISSSMKNPILLSFFKELVLSILIESESSPLYMQTVVVHNLFIKNLKHLNPRQCMKL